MTLEKSLDMKNS